MRISAVSPDAAAANPAHPDHARWVKDRTLALESAHAQVLGLSMRDAETANARNLDRLDARQARRPARKPKAVTTARRELTRADLDAGVTKRTPKARKMPVLRCGFCGVCKTCKRNRRVGEIMQRRAQHEPLAIQLANALTIMVLAHDLRKVFKDCGAEYPFDRLTGHARNAALVAATERICDRSEAAWGAWR